MPKFRIVKLDAYPLETKYGKTEKYVIENEKGTKVEMFRESFQNDWKENMEVDLEDDKIMEREYNGKKYFSYKNPKPIEKQLPRLTQSAPVIDPQNERLSRIETKLDMILGKLESRSKEIDLDQIPF